MVVAGNVVEDRVPGGWAPGGPSLYSALAAAALGWEVTLITRLPEDYPRSVLAGFNLKSEPAASAPRYANSYDASGARTQLLLDPGEPLPAEMLACDTPQDAFLLAPAFHEVAEWPFPCARHRAVALQGLLREADPAGHVSPRENAFEAVAPFVHRSMFAFLSDEDCLNPGELAQSLAESAGATVVVTRGAKGASLYARGERRDFDSLPANAVDPTGAGDCFATAFVVRYAETNDITEAMRFALAAGSLAVEAPGLAGIPSRAAIERRLEMVAA